MAVLYRHIRLDKNEPFYIGIGKDKKRAYIKNGRNPIWKKIIKKTDYEVEILFDDLTWEEACKKEKEFIKLYGRKDLNTGSLINLTDGGEGGNGYKHSIEAKEKISEARKTRKKYPYDINKLEKFLDFFRKEYKIPKHIKEFLNNK
jgi:hypothetical protein